MLAKQNGHIASPLGRTAKRDRLAASVWMTEMEGRFLHQSRKRSWEPNVADYARLTPGFEARLLQGSCDSSETEL